jgi:hypothetical protein
MKPDRQRGWLKEVFSAAEATQPAHAGLGRAGHRDLDEPTITIEDDPEPPRSRTMSELETALKTSAWNISRQSDAVQQAQALHEAMLVDHAAIKAEIARRLIAGAFEVSPAVFFEVA